MFGDVGHARTNAAMLLLTIATTSSRTCTKPTVEPTPTVKTLQYQVKAITSYLKIGQMNLSVFKRLKSSAKICLIISDL